LLALTIRPCFNPQFQQALIVLMNIARVFGLVGNELSLIYERSIYLYSFWVFFERLVFAFRNLTAKSGKGIAEVLFFNPVSSSIS